MFIIYKYKHFQYYIFTVALIQQYVSFVFIVEICIAKTTVIYFLCKVHDWRLIISFIILETVPQDDLKLEEKKKNIDCSTSWELKIIPYIY